MTSAQASWTATDIPILCRVSGNFMYKRKSNNILLQERPRPLRRFEAEVFIEHYSNHKTFEHTVKFQGAKIWNNLPIEERNLRSYDGFKQKQKEKLKLNLLAM